MSSEIVILLVHFKLDEKLKVLLKISHQNHFHYNKYDINEI